ncbi:MAG: glycosyltransferase [Candidatus Omnitrophota bacterium]
MCIVCNDKKSVDSVYGGYDYLNVRYRIVRCLGCGFMFLKPLPAKEVLAGIYKDPRYFEDYYIPGSSGLGYLQGVSVENLHHKMAITMLSRHINKGSLLDIGSAAGAFMLQAREAGFTVRGIEPNLQMADLAGKKFGLDVDAGEFREGLYPLESFDVVHLGDVLEHLLEPRESLAVIKGLLKDLGVLLIQQPLTYNNSFFNIFLKGSMLLKKDRFSHNPPAHLWEFNPGTLRKFLRDNGFIILESCVYENKAKPLFVYKRKDLKTATICFLKNLSAFFSNILPLELGDRMVLVCRKEDADSLNRKKKLLFVHPNLEVGGAEENRLSVLKYMDKNKYDIRLCCLTRKGKIAEEIEGLGYPVDFLGVSDNSYDITTTAALYKYIKKNNFDIVHSCLINTNLHSRIAARLAGVPVIISEEQSEYERYNPFVRFLLKPVNRYLSSWTDRIVVCSNGTGRAIAREDHIPFEKFLVLHNAIDPDKFKVVKSRETVLREFGLSVSDKVVGYVGSLAKRKGHMYLLEAFSRLARERDGLKLLLIGDGLLRGSLEKRASRDDLKGKVIFAGQRRDVPDILSILDVFASASMFEAFGIVLIEAMYMGVSCAAFRVGGIPEIIENGKSGILVTPRDIDGLALAIKRLLDDQGLANKFADAARIRVRDNFTADKYADKLDSLYENLLKRRRDV